MGKTRFDELLKKTIESLLAFHMAIKRQLGMIIVQKTQPQIESQFLLALTPLNPQHRLALGFGSLPISFRTQLLAHNVLIVNIVVFYCQRYAK